MRKPLIMEVFNNNNIDYQKWIKRNPIGYVVNTKPEKGHLYRVAHRTSCNYITGSNSPSRSTKYYIKVCSNNAQEIARWFAVNKLNFDGNFHECGQCNPNINSQIREVSIIYSDELDPSENILEGAAKRILVNKYERSAKARGICLAKYGHDCMVCGFNFSKIYGELGQGFIHVHHLKPIAKIGKAYRMNAIEDLRPLCPNCHAMVHARNPTLSISELKKILQKHRSK
jgi:hypothetical protein